MTKEELAIYFGERRGIAAKPKDLRLKGNWIFFRDPEWADDYPNDVELYNYPCGSMAECYDETHIDKTPFNKNLSHKELEKIINDLDKRWKKFIEDDEEENVWMRKIN